MAIPDSVTAAAFRAPAVAAPPVAAPRRREGAGDAAGPGATAASAAPASPAAPASLWDALSEDERAFFLDVSAHGPLTYGATRAAGDADTAPAPIGRHLDVRA